MIYFFVTEGHRYTIDALLAAYAGRLPVRITPITYETLADGGADLGRGACIFADLERLTVPQLKLAADIWSRIVQWDRRVRLLNHPTRVRRRYEMLRELHERGINSFNVYRLTEARRPQRYPVFIRSEIEHGGSQSPLLWSQAELEDEIARLDDIGETRDDRMIVEFCGVPDERGHYRKYASFRVGESIVPRSINFSDHWMVKTTNVALDKALRADERDFLLADPHADTIRRVFEIARIEFGRVDFGVVNGRVEIYEINTNPTLYNARAEARLAEHPNVGSRADALISALAAVDAASAQQTRRQEQPEWTR